MARTTKHLFKQLPFAGLSNYQIEFELSGARKHLSERFGSSEIFKHMHFGTDSPENSNFIDCNYFDEDSFNASILGQNIGLSVFHMNIRKLSKHRGGLVAYMSCLNIKFDIIILTEIGIDACHYISSIFKEYSCTHALPIDNDYGGVAVFIRNEELDSLVTEREDLKINKSCSCSKCVFEDIWLQCTLRGQNVTVGGVYRHPNGNRAHFMKIWIEH